MTTLSPPAPAVETTAEADRQHGHDLIDPNLFARLAARVAADHPEHADRASRIVDQALAFLGTCADRSPRGLAPSPLVDIGWHTFILFTRDYAAFCDNVCGRFIHHVPVDPATADRPAGGQVATITAIEAAGFIVDKALWTAGPKRRCDPDDCGASGQDGNENRDTRTDQDDDDKDDK